MKPYDGGTALGVDRWIEREDRREKGGRIVYRCLDCSFESTQPVSAYRHHVSQRPHHRITDMAGNRQQFSCCKESTCANHQGR